MWASAFWRHQVWRYLPCLGYKGTRWHTFKKSSTVMSPSTSRDPLTWWPDYAAAGSRKRASSNAPEENRRSQRHGSTEEDAINRCALPLDVTGASLWSVGRCTAPSARRRGWRVSFGGKEIDCWLKKTLLWRRCGILPLFVVYCSCPTE